MNGHGFHWSACGDVARGGARTLGSPLGLLYLAVAFVMIVINPWILALIIGAPVVTAVAVATYRGQSERRALTGIPGAIRTRIPPKGTACIGQHPEPNTAGVTVLVDVESTVVLIDETGRPWPVCEDHKIAGLRAINAARHPAIAGGSK